MKFLHFSIIFLCGDLSFQFLHPYYANADKSGAVIISRFLLPFGDEVPEDVAAVVAAAVVAAAVVVAAVVAAVLCRRPHPWCLR